MDAVEMGALKGRLQTVWESGDYGTFAGYMRPGTDEFFDRLSVTQGTQFLDVACGDGYLALRAAGAGASVTGIDIARNLIEQARTRAAEAGQTARFDHGDAEDLPYADASFDLVTSLIGAMFAPRPELVAAELLRVCRPGGRIVMGNWISDGFVGEMFRIIGRYVLPPKVPSPLLWGDPQVVRQRLAHGSEELTFARREFPFRYPFAPAAVVDFFCAYYGPAHRAHASLDPDGRTQLRTDLTRLWTERNTATDGTTAVPGEYLEVTALRRRGPIPERDSS